LSKLEILEKTAVANSTGGYEGFLTLGFIRKCLQNRKISISNSQKP
jgi:hypothetical protein